MSLILKSNLGLKKGRIFTFYSIFMHKKLKIYQENIVILRL